MLVVMVMTEVMIAMVMFIIMNYHCSNLRSRQRSVLPWSTQPDERRSCLSTLVHFTSAPAYKSASGLQDDKWDKITMMHW